jgi:hypothetical protein
VNDRCHGVCFYSKIQLQIFPLLQLDGSDSETQETKLLS